MRAASSLCKALLDDGKSKGEAWLIGRILLASTGMGNLPEGHAMLEDIRQIKSKSTDKWKVVAPLALPSTLMSEPIYTSSGMRLEEERPLHPFWTDWYQRTLEGRPQNWDMLRDVALIDNTLWEGGGEALDRAISFTVERHRLLDEVRRFRDSLRAAEQSPETIIGPGHNHPPESLDLDLEPDFIAICDDIQQGLEAAEQTLMEPAPSFAVLHLIGRRLGDAALAVMGYCGRLADAAAMEAAKSIGKWGGPAGIAWYMANAESIQKLAKDLLQWAASAF